MNLHTLTMLGKKELVIPMLETYPDLEFSLGAHGFTLLHHANVGSAQDLSDYLMDKGLKETHIKIR